jgi:uncharacterized protein (TIGR02246 family)
MDSRTRRDIATECGQLTHAFARYVDRNEADRVAELFTPEGTFTRKGESLKGREQIRAAIARRTSAVLTRHLCSTTHVEVQSEDRATGITYFELYRHEYKAGEESGTPVPLGKADVIGEYHDEFERTPDGWCIRARTAFGVFRRMD